MYRIFAYNPDGSQYTIYDPVYAGALPVIGPRSSEEVNEGGTVEFSLLYGHPAYGLLEPKKTYISVFLGNRDLFYGRVVNAEPAPMEGQIRYSCAGALSFLKDSEVPPDPKKADGTGDYQTMTAEAFFIRCIAAHNADIGNDVRRIFGIGTIRHSRKDEQRQYRLDTYQDTMSVIESNILSYYGGFIRTGRDEHGGLVIDWIEDQYGDTDASTLALGQNIISLSNRKNGEDLVTTIRPVGANGVLMENTQTIDLFPNGEMAEYGKIVRSVSFPNAATAADLRTQAESYAAKLQKTVLLSSDIRLVDMVFLDGNAHGVNLGDTFTHVEGMDGVSLMVTGRNRDFENPQNDSCTLKNKKAYDGNNTTDGTGSSSTLSKRSSRNSAATGVAYKYIHEFDSRLELNTKEIAINGEQIEIHAQQLVETAVEFARISHKQGETDTRLGIIEGTGVFQNSEHITQIAGKFQYDQQTGAVTLINGTEFKIHDQSGAMITVGTRLNELGQATAQIQGSALWTQRDNITGVCGEFDVITAQDGTKTLRIKSGGGIKILRNNVEYGLYDDGNLTGGVMVTKLNEGTVVTRIRGDKIDLSTNDGYTSLVADTNGLQTTVAGIQSTVTTHGTTIASMTGSTLWTQRDNITGVCGEFDVITNPDGSKYLRIKSGGGIKILRDNTEFGLYDSGTLTAGVIVDKINGGTTTISGNKVVINGTTTISSVMSVGQGGLSITQPMIVTGGTNPTIINNTDVAANNLAARTKLIFGSGAGEEGGERSLTYAILGGMIKEASVSANGLTLSLTKFNGDVINFSKAVTSMSGVWSNGTLTVTPNPQGAPAYTAALSLNFWSQANSGSTLYYVSASSADQGAERPDHRVTKRIDMAKDGNIVKLRSYDGSTPSYILNSPTYDITNELNSAKTSVTPTAIAWKSNGNYFESHNPFNADNTVGEDVQLVWQTEGSGASAAYYMTLQSRATGSSAAWNNRIRSAYRLGLSGTTIQVQSQTGTRLTNTPTYDISTELENARTEGYGTAKIKLEWAGGTLTASKVTSGESANPQKLGAGDPTWSGNTATVKVYSYTATSQLIGDTGFEVSVNASGRYNAGWGNARTSTGDFPTSANTNVGSITVKRPSATVDGTADSYTYSLATSGRTLIQLKYGQTVVAQISNPYYYTTDEYSSYGTTQYNAGWGNARTSTGDFPTSANTNVGSITVKRPSATVDGTADSYTYSLATSGRTLIQLKYGQTVVAQISNPYYYTTTEYTDYGTARYEAGQNSVTPTAISWQSSGNYFESHNPYDSTKTVGIDVRHVWQSEVSGSATVYYTTLQSRAHGSDGAWDNRIRTAYKLGLSGTTVQVQNSGGTRITDTPTYDISGYGTTRYNAGWDAARTSTGAFPVTENTNVGSITVKRPSATVDGTADSYTYSLATSGRTLIQLKYGQTVVAQIANPYYYTTTEYNNYGTTRYNDGWGAARTSTGDFPTSANTNVGSITVKRPSATVDGTADSYTYSLATSGRTLIQLKYGQTVVAQIANPYYYTTTEYNDYGTLQYGNGYTQGNSDGYTSGYNAGYITGQGSVWFFYTNTPGATNWMLTRDGPNGPYLKISTGQNDPPFQNTTWEVPEAAGTPRSVSRGSITSTVPTSAGTSVVAGRLSLGRYARPTVASYVLIELVYSDGNKRNAYIELY